jgi:hypothetical protein
MSPPGSDISIPSGSFLNRTFRVAVVCLLLGALYYELNAGKNTEILWTTFLLHLQTADWRWLLAACFLMPVNWLAETAKWRLFVHQLQPISWYHALAAILSGVSFGIFTPNRLGEFGGRLLFVDRKNHWNALLANLAGSLAQLMALLSAGIAGAWYFMTQFGYLTSWTTPLACLAILGTGLLFTAFFCIKSTLRVVRKIPGTQWLSRRIPNLQILEQANRADLAKLLAWSGLRYLVYSTQYYCLLRFFDINPGLLTAYAGIALIFLLQTALPLPAIAGLMVRGNLAVFVWSHTGANEISSLATTFFLWIINLILPALLGTFSIFHVSITKTIGYEDR